MSADVRRGGAPPGGERRWMREQGSAAATDCAVWAAEMLLRCVMNLVVAPPRDDSKHTTSRAPCPSSRITRRLHAAHRLLILAAPISQSVHPELPFTGLT